MYILVSKFYPESLTYGNFVPLNLWIDILIYDLK